MGNGNGQWEGGQYLTARQLDAGWREYVQWLLGRRQRFVVRENSMVPTLMPGDIVLAELSSAVKIGDIALVRWDRSQNASGPTDQLLTKGMAYRGSRTLLLIKRVSEIFYDGGVYLISDNTNEPNARDSRHFGVIAASHIIGRVTSRLTSSP